MQLTQVQIAAIEASAQESADLYYAEMGYEDLDQITGEQLSGDWDSVAYGEDKRKFLTRDDDETVSEDFDFEAEQNAAWELWSDKFNEFLPAAAAARRAELELKRDEEIGDKFVASVNLPGSNKFAYAVCDSETEAQTWLDDYRSGYEYQWTDLQPERITPAAEAVTWRYLDGSHVVSLHGEY